MFTFILTAAFAANIEDFLAKSDDIGKAPCVIQLVQPQGCANDQRCVRVVNAHKSIGIAPVIMGFCGPGMATIADYSGIMQAIVDPNLSTAERPIIVPVLAPRGSSHPSDGWMYLPSTVVDVSAVAYAGAWERSFPLEVRPGFIVDVFDDDPSIDIGDHVRVGTCRTQRGIVMGETKTIEFSSSCAPAELAKSNRK